MALNDKALSASSIGWLALFESSSSDWKPKRQKQCAPEAIEPTEKGHEVVLNVATRRVWWPRARSARRNQAGICAWPDFASIPVVKSDQQY